MAPVAEPGPDLAVAVGSWLSVLATDPAAAWGGALGPLALAARWLPELGPAGSGVRLLVTGGVRLPAQDPRGLRSAAVEHPGLLAREDGGSHVLSASRWLREGGRWYLTDVRFDGAWLSEGVCVHTDARVLDSGEQLVAVLRQPRRGVLAGAAAHRLSNPGELPDLQPPAGHPREGWCDFDASQGPRG